MIDAIYRQIDMNVQNLKLLRPFLILCQICNTLSPSVGDPDRSDPFFFFFFFLQIRIQTNCNRGNGSGSYPLPWKVLRNIELITITIP
jgi:hypothetical protein